MREIKDAIYFWSNNEPFSNFYKCTFVNNEITFNCSEQYFMYKKCMLFDWFSMF